MIDLHETKLRLFGALPLLIVFPGLLSAADAPAAGGPILNLTATTANLAGTPDTIRINLLRWSADKERDQMLAAWSMKAASGGKQKGAEDATDPFGAFGRAAQAAGGAPAPAPGPGARARGPARRGGRGGAPPEEPPAAAPRTPEAALADALRAAPTLGYLWSSEVAGYAIRYAVRLDQPDGGERIILVTDRRLGAWNDRWKLSAASGDANNFEFSLIELHLNARHEGEGKVSLNGKIAVDSAAKALALENYAALPVVLKNVKVAK